MGLIRRVFRLAALAFVAVLVLAGAALAAIAHPEALFASRLDAGPFTFYSDEALRPGEVEPLAARALARLEQSPLFHGDEHFNVFVVPNNWKRRLLFLMAPGAAGVVYYPLSAENIYLSEADFADDQIINFTGYRPTGNRTLTYYLAHEATHVLTGDAIGLLGLVFLPAWLREGYADLVGLGFPDDRASLAAAVEDVAEWGKAEWNTYGFYGPDRLKVEIALDGDGNGIRALLGSPPPEPALK